MEEILNKGIKEIIGKKPEVGELLERHNIVCVPCQVGTCKLKDVVEIHNLDPETERELLTRVFTILYPDQKIDVPLRARASQVPPRKASPPIRLLMAEHRLIKRLLALIPASAERLRLPDDSAMVMEITDFISHYADKFHHAKEEDLLFKEFDESAAIIQAMYKDHETGRAHVRAVREGVRSGQAGEVREHLLAYRNLLTNHIRKEDEILYPWLDKQLNTSQVGKLYAAFNATEKRFEGLEGKCSSLIEKLEQEYKKPDRDNG